MVSENPPPYFLLIIISLLYICINCHAAKPSSTSSSCPSFDCGNGLTITYPFWKQSQQSHEHCGYPGFNLSCRDKHPILTLLNYQYKLINLSRSEQTFTITYVDDHDTLNSNLDCPVAPHNTVLDLSSPPLLINYTSDDKFLNFFYNCSLYPPSLEDIKCLRLRESVKRSYAFFDGAVPEFDWEKYCETVVKAAVISQSKVDDDDDLHGDLLGGFKLKWKPDLACQSCEASGGFCGHKTNERGMKFLCFCSDGQHPFHCHDDSGTLYGSQQTNYAATGALVFGGLTMASAIIYHVHKMKFQGWLYSRIS